MNSAAPLDQSEPTPEIDVDAILARSIVLVPFHSYVEPETEYCLDQLRELGVAVKKFKGASAIDVIRNLSASKALGDGYEQFLYVDADMMFAPEDAIRLFCHPDPVVAGVYAAKKMGNGRLNVHVDPAIGKIHLGPEAPGLYRARKVGAGFLRIKCSVLARMIAHFQMPLVRMAEDYGWGFFQPFVLEEDGELRYFAEDYSFCKRLELMNVPLMIDTSFRLYHYGGYAYGWEEARGYYIARERDVDITFDEGPPLCPSPSLLRYALPTRA